MRLSLIRIDLCFSTLVSPFLFQTQASIEYTVDKMHEFGVDPWDGGVYFGQLLGMSDHLTFTLGQNGYKAYKYVPYGKVVEVIPYLVRRAQENSNMLGGVGLERKMLWKELVRRNFLPVNN